VDDRPPRRFLSRTRALSRLLLIALPLLVALQLRGAAGYDDIVAADLYVTFAGPWSCLVGLLLALRPLGGAPLGPEYLARSGRLMFVLLAAIPAGLLLLMPFDVGALQSPWRRLACWVGAGAVPLWASALRSSLVGRSRRRALLESSLVTAGVAAAGLGIGALHELDVWSLLTPMSVAGLLLAMGFVLASFEQVTAPTRWVLASAGTVALLVAEASAWMLATPPLSTAWVESIVSTDAATGRVVVSMRLPTRARSSLAEVELGTGAVDRLSPRLLWAGYAAGQRVSLTRGRLASTLMQRRGYRLCAEGLGCQGGFGTSRPPLPTAHPSAPFVLVWQAERLTVWGLADDQRWAVERPGEVIMWPCFEGDEAVLWRVRTSEGPYRNERLLLQPGAQVEQLAPGHDHSCLMPGESDSAITFVRGRRSVGKSPRLLGPGLPPEGHVFDTPVGHIARSTDGRRMVLVQFDPEAAAFRYDIARGLSDPAPIGANDQVFLGETGEYAAYARHLPGTGHQSVTVHRFDDWSILAEFPTDATPIRLDPTHGLITIEEGRLHTHALPAGPARTLFPTEG
jgi:hypothetical protein